MLISKRANNSILFSNPTSSLLILANFGYLVKGVLVCYCQAMKKLLVISYWLLVIGFLFSGCTLRLPLGKKAPSALSVSSVPTARIFLNGEDRGQTPFYDENLKSGDYTVKITTDGQEWSSKVRLNPGVLTVVNRELADNEASQSGEIITLDKGRGLAVISNPSQAEVKVDGQQKGATPLVIEDIKPGDHTVVLKAEGFLERMVKVRVQEDYKLTINMQLSAQPLVVSPQPEVPLSPPPSVEPSGPHIIVKETGTSFGLHVRSGPGLGFPVIEDIKPGEKYPLLGEEKGWVNIRLSDGREGWVSGRYVEKKE